MYLSPLFILFSSRSILLSPHLIVFWNPPNRSIFSQFFIVIYIPPFAQGGLLIHHIRLHVHHPVLHKQHLDPPRDFFQWSLSRVSHKFSFNLAERILVFDGEINVVSFLYPVEQEVD